MTDAPARDEGERAICESPPPLNTFERDQLMLQLYRQGTSMQRIGARFDLSAERVRQIIRRLEGRPAGVAPSSTKHGGERVRLRIGNMAKAVLVTGQAYQDPKDALNEFVSNAADDYAEAGRTGERIRIVLRRKGKHPLIAIDDTGRGMSRDRLREVARNLFESSKVGDDRTLGEKAIGLLAFQQLAERCDVVSRAEASDETWTLRLQRGRADASLERERRRARHQSGTTVYLSELDPDVLRVLTQRKVTGYLRRRRAAALATGQYSIEVVEGRTVELVTPEEPEGLRLAIAPQPTLSGRIEFALYIAADADRRRRVAVVGRAGTTVVDDLAELDEFDHEPWTSGQVSGQIVFPALQQAAGRRAVLRDRDAFPLFYDAVCAIEPPVGKAVERVRRELDGKTAERLSDTVRRVFDRVLRELADVDNPMHALVDEREPASNESFPPPVGDPVEEMGAPDTKGARHEPSLNRLVPMEPPRLRPSKTGGGAAERTRNLPSLEPDPSPGHARSRFVPDPGTVLYNDRHADFLLVKDDEGALLDYLSTLVAKEYVVYNNPRATSDDLAEEMVRMLVRVRRHLPRRR